MKSPEILLEQNEEIFKRMSQDFDELSKSIEKTNGNHAFLAKSIIELKEDLIKIPSKVKGQLESTKLLASSIKHQYDTDHNHIESSLNKFNTDVLSNGIKIERAIVSLDESISKINNKHELITSENRRIIDQHHDLQTKYNFFVDQLKRSVSTLEAEIVDEGLRIETQFSEKINCVLETSENNLNHLKSITSNQNKVMTKSIEDAFVRINVLEKRSNRFRNLFVTTFLVLISFGVLMYALN
jgi:hypothetical protein